MVERPILDRVSYQIHQSVESYGGSVAREWPIPGTSPTARADVVVFQGAKPATLIEGKAMYTFASIRNGGTNQKFVTRMQSDLSRLRPANLPEVAVYTLMLATNPRSPIPESLFSLMKKPKAINSALSKLNGHERLAEFTVDRMSALTAKSTRAAEGSLDAGEAYGVGVDILWWLFGPFSAPAHLQIGAV